jgi:DNA-binding LytR/AlgR family response regulator
MAISVMICDDLPEERGNLIRMLRHYEQAHGVELDLETAADGAELLALWKPERWDLLLLDIFMPQLNGIEAARQLRKVDSKCEIVFATTSREHGVEGYELHALDYLTKPISQRDVDAMMDWFLRKRSEDRSALTVRTSLGEEAVPIRDIRYIESRGHSCDIHLPERTYSVRRSIDELAGALDGVFFRCHKSFLLSFAHVSELEKNLFRMDDGSCVPVSSAYLSECRTAYLTWKAGTP